MKTWQPAKNKEENEKTNSQTSIIVCVWTTNNNNNNNNDNDDSENEKWNKWIDLKWIGDDKREKNKKTGTSIEGVFEKNHLFGSIDEEHKDYMASKVINLMKERARRQGRNIDATGRVLLHPEWQ
ncbi:hypothetical protein RFI_34914, partial [Reticulomyxa filosa]